MKSQMRILAGVLVGGVLTLLGGCVAGPLADIFFAVGPFLR